MMGSTLRSAEHVSIECKYYEKLDTVERALNAKVHHSGNNRNLGYYSAETCRFVFSETIKRRLTKGSVKVAKAEKAAAQAVKNSQKEAQAAEFSSKVA